MKKKFFFPLLAAFAIVSCNDDSKSTNTSDTTVSTTATTTDTVGTTAPATTVNTAPLDAADQEFIRKAAMGGKMEVQLGQMAQQQATNQRVKDFGNMMVTDHTQANNELMQFAQSHNFTVSDSLDKKMQDHMASMQKMTGKQFDKHYMDMMVNDHNKDIGEFEKASNSAKDSSLKAWAAKTLPTLRKHLDSAKAINKSKL